MKIISEQDYLAKCSPSHAAIYNSVEGEDHKKAHRVGMSMESNIHELILSSLEANCAELDLQGYQYLSGCVEGTINATALLAGQAFRLSRATEVEFSNEMFDLVKKYCHKGGAG